MVFSIRDIDQSQAPLLDHLIELRARLLRALGITNPPPKKERPEKISCHSHSA